MTGSILFETPSPLRLRVIFFHSELTVFFKTELDQKKIIRHFWYIYIFSIQKHGKNDRGKKWKSPALLIVQIRKFSIKRNWKIQNKYVEFSCSRFTLSQDKKSGDFKKKKNLPVLILFSYIFPPTYIHKYIFLLILFICIHTHIHIEFFVALSFAFLA